MIQDDDEAYNQFPNLQKWYNKLWLAQKLGYNCGPAGTTPDKDGKFVVRPIMNLSGMGVGAKVIEIKSGDYNSVPSGSFWCEYFDGYHYSVDYELIDDVTVGPRWKGISSWTGTNYPIDLSKFTEWKRCEYIPELHNTLKINWKEIGYSRVPFINVEFIGDKIIEVHLRKGNTLDYDHMIPVWKSWPDGTTDHFELNGFKYIENYDDADGQLEDPRLGFLVK